MSKNSERKFVKQQTKTITPTGGHIYGLFSGIIPKKQDKKDTLQKVAMITLQTLQTRTTNMNFKNKSGDWEQYPIPFETITIPANSSIVVGVDEDCMLNKTFTPGEVIQIRDMNVKSKIDEGVIRRFFNGSDVVKVSSWNVNGVDCEIPHFSAKVMERLFERTGLAPINPVPLDHSTLPTEKYPMFKPCFAAVSGTKKGTVNNVTYEVTRMPNTAVENAITYLIGGDSKPKRVGIKGNDRIIVSESNGTDEKKVWYHFTKWIAWDNAFQVGLGESNKDGTGASLRDSELWSQILGPLVMASRNILVSPINCETTRRMEGMNAKLETDNGTVLRYDDGPVAPVAPKPVGKSETFHGMSELENALIYFDMSTLLSRFGILISGEAVGRYMDDLMEAGIIMDQQQCKRCQNVHCLGLVTPSNMTMMKSVTARRNDYTVDGRTFVLGRFKITNFVSYEAAVKDVNELMLAKTCSFEAVESVILNGIVPGIRVIAGVVDAGSARAMTNPEAVDTEESANAKIAAATAAKAEEKLKALTNHMSSDRYNLKDYLVYKLPSTVLKYDAADAFAENMPLFVKSTLMTDFEKAPKGKLLDECGFEMEEANMKRAAEELFAERNKKQKTDADTISVSQV